MSAYIPNFQHDIFVSYAHVDNVPMPGYQEGWVSTLIEGLKIHLSQKLGRSDRFSLWKDEQLAPNRPLTPEIMKAVQQSATLLIILSPGYRASPWCQREMQTFWREVASRSSGDSRIFVVERDKLELQEKPEELKDLLGYQFWFQERESRATRILGVPEAKGDKNYYDKLGDLAYDLANELKRLKANAGVIAAANTATETQLDDRPAVFLAEVTDDLDMQRDQVSRYLDQAGFRVVPAGTSNYSAYLGGNEDLAGKIASELKNCRLFVQLLSGLPGKIISGKPSFPAVQYQTALGLKIPVMQWHDPALELESINYEEHRGLVAGDKVMAVGLEEFKQECVKRLQAQLQPPKLKPTVNMVYLNTSLEDRQLGEEISRELKRRNIACGLPAFSDDPKLNDEEHKAFLADCDGLIFIYGPTTLTWARSQIRMGLRTIAMRERPLKALAVFDGPPENKPDLGIDIPGMITLNCRKGLQPGDLDPFADPLG